MMRELFEAGYTVTCGTVWGDYTLKDEDDLLEFEGDEEYELDEVDHEAKTAYFFAEEDWDSYGEDL